MTSLNGVFKTLLKNTDAGKTAGDDAKEIEALGECFGTMNKKRVHKGETEASKKCSRIFVEFLRALQKYIMP